MSHSPGDGCSPRSVALVIHNADVAVVSLTGELDIAQREELRDALDTAAGRRRHVVADLAGCTFIDSSIISCLLYGNELLRDRGGTWALIAPRPETPTARLFAMVGIAEMMPVHSSLEDALARLVNGTRVRDA